MIVGWEILMFEKLTGIAVNTYIQLTECKNEGVCHPLLGCHEGKCDVIRVRRYNILLTTQNLNTCPGVFRIIIAAVKHFVETQFDRIS